MKRKTQLCEHELDGIKNLKPLKNPCHILNSVAWVLPKLHGAAPLNFIIV